MGRRRNRERTPKTIHFRRENKEYVERLAREEERDFSPMVDILISRLRRQEEGAA